MAFIRLADLIINVDCIAAVKFTTYNAFDKGKDVPLVNICLRLPEGALDSETVEDANQLQGIEKLEFEGELALEVWNYFTQSKAVTILFE